MSNLKIIYEDISVTAKEDSNLSSNGLQTFCDITSLKREKNENLGKYASLEYKRWKLDGTYKNLPNDLSEKIAVYWSEQMSDENGIFQNKPTIEINFDNYETAVGITIDFDEISGDYANDLTISWWQNETLLSTKNFFPDGVQYFASNYIQNFNKMIIQFNSTSKPYRYAKISNISYGIVRTFTNSDISQISVIEDVNLLSEQISINTMDFNLQNNSGVVFSFQKRQPIKLYFKEKLLGIYYITKSTQTSNRTFEIEAEDMIGALDRYTFLGGMYNNTNVSEIIASIFGTLIPYELDASFASKTITGYIPICTSREALTNIAFVLGAVVTTANSDKILIKPLPTTISQTYDETKVFVDTSLENNDKVTAIEITAYEYTADASVEAKQLYKGNETKAFVKFDNAYHTLACVGGTIVESNCNYAVITLNANSTEMTLTGKQYDASQTVFSKVDTIITVVDFENKFEFSDCKIINNLNANEVLNRLYDFYITNKNNNSIITLDMSNGGKIGDKVEFETEYQGKKVGYITELDFEPLASKLFAKTKIKVLEG